MKNLENVVGLQEMSLQEMEETDGGVHLVVFLTNYLFFTAMAGAFEAGRDAAAAAR